MSSTIFFLIASASAVCTTDSDCTGSEVCAAKKLGYVVPGYPASETNHAHFTIDRADVTEGVCVDESVAIADGATCTDSNFCKLDLFYCQFVANTGTCEALPTSNDGAVNCTDGGLCANNNYCATVSDGYFAPVTDNSGKCYRRLADEASCNNDGSLGACSMDSYCSSSVCTASPGTGAACTTTGLCQTGHACLTSDHSPANDDTGACWKLNGDGGECVDANHTWCETGFICNSGICESSGLPQKGEPCTATGECETGMVCLSDTQQPATDDTGKCYRANNKGLACDASGFEWCLSSLKCDEGTCQDLYGDGTLGSSCAAGALCVDGLYCIDVSDTGVASVCTSDTAHLGKCLNPVRCGTDNDSFACEGQPCHGDLFCASESLFCDSRNMRCNARGDTGTPCRNNNLCNSADDFCHTTEQDQIGWCEHGTSGSYAMFATASLALVTSFF